MTVTRGVFKEIYAPQGWTKVEEPVVNSAETEDDGQSGTDTEEDNQNGSDEEEDDTDEEPDNSKDEDEESDEELDGDEESDEDLLEKPLSELSFTELQRVAELKNVDITGLRSKKEIRNKLKSKL
jgi:hypothetical protein